MLDVLIKYNWHQKREAFLALKRRFEGDRLRNKHLDRSDALICGFGQQCDRFVLATIFEKWVHQSKLMKSRKLIGAVNIVAIIKSLRQRRIVGALFALHQNVIDFHIQATRNLERLARRRLESANEKIKYHDERRKKTKRGVADANDRHAAMMAHIRDVWEMCGPEFVNLHVHDEPPLNPRNTLGIRKTNN